MTSLFSNTPVDGSSSLEPSLALVLYTDSRRGDVVCATEHKVSENHTLSIGKTVSSDHIINKITMLNSANRNGCSQLLPSNLILDSTSSMVWHKERFTADMWFRLPTQKKVERLRVEWPPLLFVVNKLNRSISAFALGTNKRPGLNSRVYHAPLMNLSCDGHLCLGTASLPKEFDFNSLADCEDALVQSQFTHVNHEYTWNRKTDSEEHFRLWSSLSAAKGETPERLKVKLLRPKCYLKDILGGLE